MDDCGFLDMMNVGSGEVNWSETQYSNPIPEQETMSTPDVSAPAKSKSKPAKAPSTKGKNWSSAEDKVLIQAWVNTSLDASIGTDQSANCYWVRISEYYNMHKEPSWPERNQNAVNCRYTAISAATSKFCGCVQQILNKNESGRTLDEKHNDAHLLFKSLDPKERPFTLMHCYVELEKHPKWKTSGPGSQKKQKKTVDASPGSTSNDEVFGVCTDSLEKEQRPRGTKFDKEQKGKAQASDGVKLSLESVWAQKIEKDDIKEVAKSARYAQAFALQKKQIELQEREDARKQFELEEKIMFMDTSRMSDAQKKFYEDKQEEIVARRHHTSG